MGQTTRKTCKHCHNMAIIHEDSQDCKNDGLIPKPPMHNTVHSILVARNESVIVVIGSRASFQYWYSHISMV